MSKLTTASYAIDLQARANPDIWVCSWSSVDTSRWRKVWRVWVVCRTCHGLVRCSKDEESDEVFAASF